MEIGSEFSLNFIDLSIKKNNIFKYLSDYNAVYFNYARCAIGYLSDNLLDDNNYVFLPSYICESVVEAFKSKKIVFYQLNNDFSINIEDLKKKLELYKCSIIYLMNYWGQDNNKSIYQELTDLKIKYEFYLVEDTTHSIFTNVGVIADFYVCSLRKWMPIPDGAVLYYKNDLLKMGHLEKSSTSYKIYGMSF